MSRFPVGHRKAFLLLATRAEGALLATEGDQVIVSAGIAVQAGAEIAAVAGIGLVGEGCDTSCFAALEGIFILLRCAMQDSHHASLWRSLVLRGGLEPPHPKALPPEDSVSTNSTT